jgi:predicted nuclease of predicted toxin-antitoxin system
MQFIANENIPLKSVQRLREEEHDIIAIAEEKPGATDPVVLRYAASEQRILLTFDRDYGELIYRLGLPAPAGIVYFRFIPTTPEEPAERLLELVQVPELSLEGQFTVIGEGQVRQRPLPGM